MSPIQKQVYDLTAKDLDRHTLWAFALDEGGEEGQPGFIVLENSKTMHTRSVA
jgi:hypothetical protein